MFEEGTNCVWVAEYEPESSFRVALFEDFVNFFPNVKAEKAMVRKAYVMERGFFLVCIGVREECFVEKSTDVPVNMVWGVSVILKKGCEKFQFYMGGLPCGTNVKASVK